MKPPSTVIVGPYRWRVVIDADAIARRSVDATAELQGHTDARTQTIAIAPGMGPDAEAETVLHEVVHACFEMVELGLSVEQEEAITRHLGFVLLDVLRRNPRLLAYLLGNR